MKKQFLLAILIIATATSCTRIEAGYEGVLFKQYGSSKGVQSAILVSGRVWYNPLTQDVYEFPTFLQTVDFEPFSVNSKDGSEFVIDPTLTFTIVPTKSPEIFKRHRKEVGDIAKTTIYGFVKDAYRIQMNRYTTDEIVSNRSKFETDVQVTLAAVLLKENFKYENLTSGLQYPKTIVEAINDKNKSVQDAMKAQNDLVTEEARAKKLIIQAKAEKEANDLKQSSLTPLLIQQRFIEKWDGKTPLYGNAPTFFKNVQ